MKFFRTRMTADFLQSTVGAHATKIMFFGFEAYIIYRARIQQTRNRQAKANAPATIMLFRDDLLPQTEGSYNGGFIFFSC